MSYFGTVALARLLH